jgi:hypothetical protein
MAVAMTVGATKIQILTQNVLASLDDESRPKDEHKSSEAVAKDKKTPS